MEPPRSPSTLSLYPLIIINIYIYLYSYYCAPSRESHGSSRALPGRHVSGRGRPTRLLDSSFARFAEAARCLLRVGLAAHAQHGSSIRRSTACGPRCCCRASPARRPPSSPRPLRASLPAAAPPPTVRGPRRALFSLPPRDSARSHCVSFSFSFSSRGGGVGFREGLGEGGVLAPCEEGSGGGVRPLCVGAPGPADAAVLPVQFRQPAALLLHCLCLQAIGEFQIHSIVRLPPSS